MSRLRAYIYLLHLRRLKTERLKSSIVFQIAPTLIMSAIIRSDSHHRSTFNQVSIALASCFLLQHHGVEAYQLLVNDSSVDGIYPFSLEIHSILDVNTSAVVGELYQDYIYNADGTTRVGTHQGFAFNFDNGTQFNSNDILFLDDGEINSMDPYIVSATGAYKRNSLGRCLIGRWCRMNHMRRKFYLSSLMKRMFSLIQSMRTTAFYHFA